MSTHKFRTLAEDAYRKRDLTPALLREYARIRGKVSRQAIDRTMGKYNLSAHDLDLNLRTKG